MSNQTTGTVGPFSFTLIAHAGPEGRLLLLKATAAPLSGSSQMKPRLNLSIVIDRSGSMEGAKLEITRTAAADFLRSLSPVDRVGVVVYDDDVSVLSPLSAPSSAVIDRVAAIVSRGSTNLYGGWVLGAKLLPRGGRVILLSDGQANVGPYTDAASLSQHASISFEKYKITTTTIGVGDDYDESLMAGMARAGGGNHYFASNASAIRDSFSQERYSAGSVVAGFASVRHRNTTVSLGHFWGGETKQIVLEDPDLSAALTLRFTIPGDSGHQTVVLDLPTMFGFSAEATLEFLTQQAAALEVRAGEVRNPETAQVIGACIRELLLKFLAHQLADSDSARTVISRLRASKERLEVLAQRYTEGEALVHRKRSMQSSHNIRNRAQAYSSFDDEAETVAMDYAVAMSQIPQREALVDQEAFRAVPVETWKKWRAIPIQSDDSVLHVGMQNPKDGFTIAEIEGAIGKPVRAVPLSETEIMKGLSGL